MKLNFLEVLSGKDHKADDIAREIVALEGKIDELKVEAAKYHQMSRDIRSKRMCGDQVSARDVDTLRWKVTEIEDDIALCNETRQTLEDRLRERMKNDKEEELAEIDQALKEMRSHERDHYLEIAKLRGRVEAMGYLVRSTSGHFEPNEFDRIIAGERDRVLQEASRPSLSDKDKELRRRQFILRAMNLQAEFTTLLERHRKEQVSVS